jgi:ATP-binding cassette subfamily B (MDR/TAP) protein 1
LGENLTYTFRQKLFEGILYKQVSWFDNKERAPGVLTNMLAEDITEINGLTTETISVYLEALTGILIGFIIAVCYTWKMALVSIAASPFVVLGAMAMSKTQQRGALGGNGGEDKYKEANALLSDIIINYRTIISFGDKNINHLMEKFQELLLAPNRDNIVSAHLTGFFFGYSSFARYCYVAFVFYIAAVFIFRQGDDPMKTFVGVYVVFISALGCGTQLSHAPSMGKARDAANKVFSIIDEKSSIDVRENKGYTKVEKGEIVLENVDFRYPSKKQKVLNKLNLTIPATKKIALVGHSGCGKSTITNLLLRFYDVSGGCIKIDGIDIRDYNIGELRRQIGFVMQEPLLFNISIKDNILYGNDNATDLEVRQVAEQANALQFIESNIEDLDQEDVKK